jgi:hypothetical protein
MKRILAIAALAAGFAAGPARAQTSAGPTISVTPEVSSVTVVQGRTTQFRVDLDANADLGNPVFVAVAVAPLGQPPPGDFGSPNLGTPPPGDFANPNFQGILAFTEHATIRFSDEHHGKCKQDHPGGCALVTLITTAQTQPGTYTVYVSAAGVDASTGQASVPVTVVGTPPLTISTTHSGGVRVPPGGQYTIPLFGGGPPTNYSATVFPPAPGVTVTFSDPPASNLGPGGTDSTGGGFTGTTVATIGASADTAQGNYTVRVTSTNALTGQSGSVSVVTTVVNTHIIPSGTYAFTFHGTYIDNAISPTDSDSNRYETTGWITLGAPYPDGSALIVAGRRTVVQGTEVFSDVLEAGPVTAMVVDPADPTGRTFVMYMNWADSSNPPFDEIYHAVFAADGSIFFGGQFLIGGSSVGYGQGTAKPAN